MTDPDGKGDDATGYVYSHMTGHGDTTITIRPSIGIRIWRDARITIYDYRNSGVAGCGYMTASIYLISFFYYRYFKCLKSLFDRLPSGMIAWIRMYRTFYLLDYQITVLHPVICRNLSFSNCSCHSFFLCGCCLFSRSIMVMLPDGKSHLHHNHEL